MTDRITCQKCGTSNIINENDINKCKICGELVNIITEYVEIGGSKHLKVEIPEIEEGTIVKINNKEHPWHDEIAIVRDRKHKLVRIELHGMMIWVPDTWIKIDEHIEHDS